MILIPKDLNFKEINPEIKNITDLENYIKKHAIEIDSAKNINISDLRKNPIRIGNHVYVKNKDSFKIIEIYEKKEIEQTMKNIKADCYLIDEYDSQQILRFFRIKSGELFEVFR